MMLHGCVPGHFGVVTVVPLVKDSLSNANDSANYRGITLSVFLSKMFEYCLINKYENFMPSNDLQFGFKKKMGCSHAIFAVHQCVDYFVKAGSSVFMAALDATKAFDRVNHIKLFHRILDKRMPIFVVKIIANWYSKNLSTVRWNNHHSEFFSC